MNKPLCQYLYSSLEYHEDEVLSAFVDKITGQYADAVIAIIFYGSCMRSREYKDAMLDFYVVVDTYKNTYKSRWLTIANSVLPPNVFYLEVFINDEIYRAKFAIISKQALMKKVSRRAFHSYFWARFAQPFSYLFLHNDQDKNWLVHIQESAITTFHNNVSGSINNTVASQEFWVKGFELTYLSELRAESENRADSIYKANASFYDEVFKKLPVIGNQRSGNLFVWKLRMALGKLLSLMRLLKATTTFTNGVDYIAWKIERHTGEKIEVTDRLRKYPWLFIWPILIRLIRNKSVR
jgi:hypothetical protein